ncbi:MAG: recombinase family protein [Paracoccaceae bacterium]
MIDDCELDFACYDQGMSNTKKGRKIGYIRVSDKDQSEDLQIDALRAAHCDLIYGDHGVSGAISHRIGLDEMLASLTSGDTLVVWKLDRLGRSTVHLLQLLSDLRDRGIDFQAITQGIDTTTAIGRMLYGQLAVFAEFERENIRERTKAGMAAARKRGVHIGRPKAVSDEQARQSAQRIRTGEIKLADIAVELGVSPRTLLRAVEAQSEKEET